AGHLTLQFVVFAAEIDEAATGDSDGSGRTGLATFSQFSRLDVGKWGKTGLRLLDQRIKFFPLGSGRAELPQGIQTRQIGIVAAPLPMLHGAFGGVQEPG